MLRLLFIQSLQYPRMLTHRLRSWTNIKPALVQRLVWKVRLNHAYIFVCEPHVGIT